MVGGLLNLIAVGPEDIILIGNPTKSFFKRVYAKYTNFGLQRFRIDMEGEKELQISESSTFKFKIPRYADLLMDTYFVMTLPNIWSPIYATNDNTNCSNCRTGNTSAVSTTGCTNTYSPIINHYRQYAYEFKWIDSIGAQMIKNIRIMSDDQVLQEFTGQYLYSMVQRDFSVDKKNLFDEMIGNVSELNDPANYSNRNGSYPNASYMGFTEHEMPHGLEPSIRGKQLYVPLNIWSTLSSKMALPLVSMQYSVLSIEVELRPIDELFVVRNIEKALKDFPTINLTDCSINIIDIYPEPYIHPDCTNELYQFYLFLKEPPPASTSGYTTMGTIDPATSFTQEHYYPRRTNWTADIHLVGTYVFLDDDEVRQFATKCQSYLIKEVHEQTKYNLIGQQYTPIQSVGLVSSWMWFFQRTDVNKRNQWSNYSNWPTLKAPSQANNTAIYSLITYLKNELFAAGNLTVLMETRPLEFMLIWEIFIALPLFMKRSTIISPFNPPNFFFHDGVRIDRALTFNAGVGLAGKNLKYSVALWYAAVGANPAIPSDPNALTAPIRSPWPLSTWAYPTPTPPPPAPPINLPPYPETFDQNLKNDWNHPMIALNDPSGSSTPGYVGRASPISYWPHGTEFHDDATQYQNLVPIPTKENFPVPPFSYPLNIEWSLATSIPESGERNGLFTTSNWGAIPTTDFSNNAQWYSTSAMPYCPMVCPSNNSIAIGYGLCNCNDTGTILGCPAVPPPIWVPYPHSGTCPPIEKPPDHPPIPSLNPPPKYWCEEFDASGSYIEIMEKWDVAFNLVLAWQEIKDYPCGHICPLTGVLGDVYITGEQTTNNISNIMLDWGFNLDETVRETVLPAGVANYIDKYNRTAGNAKPGLYCYNFCLDTNPFVFQPSGAINMSKFSTVSWSYRVMEPVSEMADSVPVSITCDADGVPINDKVASSSTAVNYWKNFAYAYNLHIMEERYNILVIENGVARLALAR